MLTKSVNNKDIKQEIEKFNPIPETNVVSLLIKLEYYSDIITATDIIMSFKSCSPGNSQISNIVTLLLQHIDPKE